MRHGPGKYLTGSALDSRVAQFGGRSFVRSVQRGTITIGGGSTSNTATITTVDTANAVLTLLGSSAETGAANYGPALCRLALTNATTITATRDASTNDTIVSYEVLEYWPGVIKQVQRGTITLASTVTSATATITASTLTRTSLTSLGFTGNDGANPSRTMTKLVLTNTTTVTASRFNGDGGSATVIGYQAVEFY